MAQWLRGCHVYYIGCGVGSICLLIYSLFFSVHTQAQSPQSKPIYKPIKGTTSLYHTITPSMSSDVLLNPGKGWVLYGSPFEQSPASLAYGAVGYQRYDWSDIEPTEGYYNWSIIDNDLQAWIAYGKQFAFGVMSADSSSWQIRYVTPKWVFADGAAFVKSNTFDDVTNKRGVQYEPVWNDPIFLQKVQDFLFALAQRYDGNPAIAFIDIRSYGNWGEQHVGGIYPSAALSMAGVQEHIQLYRNAFKHTRLIVPWGMPIYNSVYNWAINNNISIRRDGLMVDSNGSEVIRAYGKVPAIFEFYGSYQWLVSHDYWSTIKLINDVRIGKASYISMGQWGDDAQVMAAKEPDLLQTLANTMGYYFVLNSVTFSSTISNNKASKISLSWSNKGVAYLYEPAYVAVALLDNNNTVVQKQWFTGSHPQTWTPDRSTTENANLRFSGVQPGAYKLAVGLFNDTIANNPIYKIGNQGRTSTGWYVLADAISVL